MEKFSDISLVTKVVVFSDKKAFDSLVRKYQSAIRRFFLNQTLGDKQLSDDLAQDTFLKVYTNLKSFHGLANFSTWLYRIAYNVLYDYRRAQKITENIDIAAGKQGETSTGSGLKIDFYEALKILKHDERLCITLQVVDGLSIDKIANITGLAMGTVKSHLSRGKDKLAIYLKSNGYDRR